MCLIMKIYRYLAVLCCLFVLPLLLTSLIVGKDTKKKIKGDVCSASNPAGICTAANTCGSASAPCTVEIKRSGGSYATATPDFRELPARMRNQNSRHSLGIQVGNQPLPAGLSLNV